MARTLTLHNGELVSAAEVKTAFEAGQAVLVHNRANGGSSTGLALDGENCDTRGQCESVWDEVWTTAPADLRQALFYAL